MEVVVPGPGPRRVLYLPDGVKTILVPLGATLVSFGLADIAFLGFGQDSLGGRNPFSLVHVPLPSESYSLVAMALIMGAVAVDTKRWMLPLVVGIIAQWLVVGLAMHSGFEPGWIAFNVAGQKVLGARCATTSAAMVLNAALIIIWVHRQRRAR